MTTGASTLRIETYPPVNGNHYLVVSGRLDSGSYHELEEAVAPLLDSQPNAVVLDLAHLEYISSAGVRVILQARKALAPHDGQVLLVNPQAQIRKVLDIVKAVPLESIFASTAEADAYLDRVQRRVLDGDDGD
jgi:anti-anti-sigma factor